MAKTIKFNLICDGKPVRTIDDLQNNFSIEDMLTYYDNKLLHRWLKVRGYENELESVNEINDSEPIEIIKKLINIFSIETDNNTVEESIYMLKYLNENKKLYSKYESEKTNFKELICNYHAGYYNLITSIIDNCSSTSFIKSAISEMTEKYYEIFKYDHRRLFYRFENSAPLAIFLLLANEKTRNYYLPVKIEEKSKDNTVSGDIERDGMEIKPISAVRNSNSDPLKFDIDLPANKDKKEMYDLLKNTDSDTLHSILGDNLKYFSGETNQYWKDLEPNGKKFMILHMDYGDGVRSQGSGNKELVQSDVNGKFVILDGIDYKSNFSHHALYYLEV